MQGDHHIRDFAYKLLVIPRGSIFCGIIPKEPRLRSTFNGYSSIHGTESKNLIIIFNLKDSLLNAKRVRQMKSNFLLIYCNN